MGTLIRIGKSSLGTSRYALMDDAGSVTTYVIPAAGLRLAPHVGRRVAVTARFTTQTKEELPSIVAERVSALSDISDHGSLARGDGTEADEGHSLSSGLDAAVEDIEPDIIIPRIVSDDGKDGDDGVRPALFDAAPAAANDSGVRPAAATQLVPQQSVPPVPFDPRWDAPGRAPTGSCPDGTCHRPGCATCGDCPCGPSGILWVQADYLLWWTAAMDLPPLVTTSPAGTTADNAGVLGQPGTQILFGNAEVLDDTRSGGRLRMGKWLDDCQWVGLEGEYFFLADESADFQRSSTGDPILARPFFNVDEGVQDSQLVAFPNVVSGTVTVRADTQLHSAAPRFRINLICENFLPDPALGFGPCPTCTDPYLQEPGGYRFDLLLGYRFLLLDEELSVHDDLAQLQNNVVTNFDSRDSFNTENEFHGGELGLLWEGYSGPWSLELIGKVALGNHHQVVAINGSTQSSVQGVSFSDVGGLLALASNIGRRTEDDFAAISEVSATFGYRIAPSMRLLAGYTFLYWDDVVRPGEQIDLSINPNLLPPIQTPVGESRPRFVMRDTFFWAQGLTFGLDVRW